MVLKTQVQHEYAVTRVRNQLLTTLANGVITFNEENTSPVALGLKAAFQIGDFLFPETNTALARSRSRTETTTKRKNPNFRGQPTFIRRTRLRTKKPFRFTHVTRFNN